MKAALTLILVMLLAKASAQCLIDPYQDHTGQPFTLFTNGSGPNFNGEYMVILTQEGLHWRVAPQLRMKIEVVSFPFTPLLGAKAIPGQRNLFMPDITSYGYNGTPGHCQGWAWKSEQTAAGNRTLMRVHEGVFGPFGQNGKLSWQAALATTMYDDPLGQAPCEQDGEIRVELPHTVLKHTLYWVDAGVVRDSLSWVYDNTRGRMRYYPFCPNDDPGTGPEHYDVVFRPMVQFDPAGHTYLETTNAGWTGIPTGTANYFPVSADSTLYSELTSNYDAEDNDGYPALPPYSLVDAPALNHTGAHYAGYSQTNDSLINSVGPAIRHTYTIDKPIDLRIINPSERIIYNPSEVEVRMAPGYPGDTLVFPSGYTFRTVHGTHPSKAAVEAVDPDGLYPHPLLAPIPSSLGDSSSIYTIRPGNTLRIEPCVTIMDAVLIVDSGATVVWDSTAVKGNYHFTWLPGSNNVHEPASNQAPCPWNCYRADFYDTTSITINGLQTWTANNLPGANMAGHLYICDTLRIPQDQRLIIEPGVTLAFGPRGRVIVERGGQLNADGAVFTNACELMWQGMEVWGEINHAQYPYLGNTATGRAFLDDCVVQNARIGARVYKPGTSAYNSGVFQASGTVFRNNHFDVEVRPTYIFDDTTQLANICRFDSCTFESTQPLLDPAYYAGGLPTGTSEHLRLVDVKNIQVTNCTFRNLVNAAPHLRSTGIMGFNAGLIARGNRFQGLSQGIWAANFPGMRMVLVRDNTFENTIHNVVLQGTTLSEVTRNTINVPPSAHWPYAEDDVDRGNNQPVGVYLLGSTDYNVEDNTITGAEPNLEADANAWSRGIVASESMYTEQPNDPYPGIPNDELTLVDQDHSSANIYYNRITGFTIGMQLEGDNKGKFDPAVDTLAGLGLLVECNDLENSYENFLYDMVVVGNYDNPGFTYKGKLRDQGNCFEPNLQAGNTFSQCWSGGVLKEHFYYDSNCELDSFRYSDQETMLPAVDCTNLVPLDQRVACQPQLGERNCQTTIGCDAPCLHARKQFIRHRIDSLNVILIDPNWEPLNRAELEAMRAGLRAHERQLHNAELRHYLEHEDMDSLLAVIMRDQGGAKLRNDLYYLIETGNYIAADSLIQVIIALEGGVVSSHTQLMMLRLSMLQGLQTPDSLSTGQRALLNAMIEADPQGAASAKALLAAAYGSRYQRIPWQLNDTRPGRSLLRRDAPTGGLQLWPNPSQGSISILCDRPMERIEIYDPLGRLVRIFALPAVQRWDLDIPGLTPGCYSVRVTTPSAIQTKGLVIEP